MKKILILIFTFLCLLLTGCTNQVEQKIESIVVDEKEITLYIGESATIEYQILPSGFEEKIILEIANSFIATLTENVVTALSHGKTYVTLTSSSNEEISKIIYITVAKRTYDITYELDGGSFTENVTYVFEENTGLSTLPTPTKKGFNFIGWYEGDKQVNAISADTNKDVTLTAKWEEIYVPKTFNITYELDGGSFKESVITSFTENIGLESLPTPTKEGFNFIGWYEGDKQVNEISADTNKDVTLTAKWEEIYVPKTFNITYELDGGSFKGSVITSFTENIGLESLPTPTKTDYLFLGWYIEDKLVDSISPDTNKDVTLTAKWEKIIDREAAQLIISLINALPYHTTYNDKAKVEDIKAKYDELNQETQNIVSNIDELNKKITELEDIENNITEITYVLGDNVYTSKEELFTNFFSDFYKYIVSYHGDSYLKNNRIINIYNIDEFVELAKDFDGAGYSNLYGIGHLAGRYMLVKDVNGILENQPTSGFFGYCYQNNLYKDLLPFFIRFFAYWRIDERYANESNYGADIFAEGWAPTVDIAKFFYYNETNLPVASLNTDRMIDCFTNIASVVYTDLPTTPTVGMTLPTDLKLRGYVFEGWYDNPEFTGEKITSIEDTSKKIILYAKWSVDKNSFDKDSAEMVDVYIYNLTTAPANLNKRTVQYVRDMYDKLSLEAKALVTNYNTLIQYEEKYAEMFDEPITVNVTTKLDEQLSLEDIRNDFISDFNSLTGSSIESIEELTNKKYTYMKKISQFYTNNATRSKWLYLLDVLYEENCFVGLDIQINRIIANESGDVEYVTAALGLLLSGADGTENQEVLVDYSTPDKVNEVINSYGAYQMTFEKAIHLPSMNINGYVFLGFYDSDNNLITLASEGMPKNLIAVYTKN